MKSNKQIYIVSDSTGITTEISVNFALSQFRGAEVEVNRVTMVRDKAVLIDVVQSAKKTDGVIVYTFVSEALRRFFLSEIAGKGVRTVDLMGDLLGAFTKFLKTPPTERPSHHRELNESYFRGIEAIEYTVTHDDGQDPDGLHLADIVIVGVSRTSKTPLSIFLSSQYFLRIANIPIIFEVGLPHQLFRLDKERVVGLIISPKRLMEIRRVRIERTDFRVPPMYTEYDHIVKELENSNRLFTINGWVIIDVTDKSIEEVASEIMRVMRGR